MNRLNFYRVVFRLTNGKELPITVATNDIHRIEPLVESRKMLYSNNEYSVDSFFVADTRYGFAMAPDQYQSELVYCDIVDEPETAQPPKTKLGQSWDLGSFKL